jgi:hypothetical protein
MDKNEISGYRWEGTEFTSAHDYPLPALWEKLDRAEVEVMGSKRVSEPGCEKGYVGYILVQNEWNMSSKVKDTHLRRGGRIPPLAKFMIAIVTKP